MYWFVQSETVAKFVILNEVQRNKNLILLFCKEFFSERQW